MNIHKRISNCLFNGILIFASVFFIVVGLNYIFEFFCFETIEKIFMIYLLFIVICILYFIDYIVNLIIDDENLYEKMNKIGIMFFYLLIINVLLYVVIEGASVSSVIYDPGLIVDKPILYLYPENDMDVSVRLDKDNVKTSYPKYRDGWDVFVKSDGSIYDRDGKYYYALYWDEYAYKDIDFKEGFYVDKDNALEFLEEKLNIIGLNDRERNEFIMYWLPKLEDNGKNLVYFELTRERESNNKLDIEPKPDSLLRIVIHIKKVNKKINIKEQKLDKFDRKGFVAVEWGGTIH